MADDGFRPIIVKRIKKSGDGHNGGAWKIAYADFVTAMMSFFLLMWLLGSVSKGTLKGISEYFQNPVKVSMSGGSGSGDSTSVIQGGGPGVAENVVDPVGKGGEVDLQKSKAELERQEGLRLGELKARLESAIDANKTLKQFKKQLLVDITTEGLRIQIVDEKNRPMFAMSKAELQPYTKEILHEIGRVLNDVPNKISLSGHTDATPYASGEKSYSNWELSADRANASRRELISGGMEENKILRVVGLSSAVLMDKDDPFNPINRRISIIVMNKKTEEAVSKDGGTLNVSHSSDVKAGLNGGK